MEKTLSIVASNLADVEMTCYDTLGRMKSSASDIALQGVTGRSSSVSFLVLCHYMTDYNMQHQGAVGNGKSQLCMN